MSTNPKPYVKLHGFISQQIFHRNTTKVLTVTEIFRGISNLQFWRTPASVLTDANGTVRRESTPIFHAVSRDQHQNFARTRWPSGAVNDPFDNFLATPFPSLNVHTVKMISNSTLS